MNCDLSPGCWETGGETPLQERSLSEFHPWRSRRGKRRDAHPAPTSASRPKGPGAIAPEGKRDSIPELRGSADTSGQGAAAAGATGRDPLNLGERGDGHGTGGGSGSGMLPPRCREPNPWRLPQLPRRSLPHGRSRGPALPPSASLPSAEQRYWLLPALRRRPPSPGPGRGRGVRAHGSAYKGAASQPPGSFWSKATGAAGRGVSPGEHGSGGGTGKRLHGQGL